MVETEESHLRNQSRIKNLVDLVFVDNLEQIATDDVEKVRQYEESIFPWRKTQQGQNVATKRKGHILGDVYVNQPHTTAVSGFIVPLVALLVAGFAVWKAMDAMTPPVVPATPPKDEVVVKTPIDVVAPELGIGGGFGEPEWIGYGDE